MGNVLPFPGKEGKVEKEKPWVVPRRYLALIRKINECSSVGISAQLENGICEHCSRHGTLVLGACADCVMEAENGEAET